MITAQAHRSFSLVRKALSSGARGLACTLFVFLPLPDITDAAAATPGAPPTSSDATTQDVLRNVLLFPDQSLYPPYLADPHRTCFSVQYLHFTDVGIADSGDSRFNLKAGGRFGLLRFSAGGRPDRGWQLDVEGGLNAQFDIDHHLDAVGWEGKYGLMLSTKQSDSLALKLGFNHISSHVGDEYAERTGRLRIGYTRHEIAGGMSYTVTDHWRSYGEFGWGYDLKNDILQEPFRVQAGLEYAGPRTLLGNSAAWYAAVDAASWQERGWRIDKTVQTGIVVRRVSRTWRFGVEYHRGRPTLGEFFNTSEESLSLGVWLEV